MEYIDIETEFIKLDQFLKWAGVVDSGVAGKAAVQSGDVRVNGQVELQRGKKLRDGDVVEIGDQKLTVRRPQV